MKKTVLAALAILIIGAGGPFVAGAGEYSGPGFSGIAWYGENGTADKKLGPVNVDTPGFRMEVRQQGQHIAVVALWDQEISYSLLLEEKMYLEIPTEDTGTSAADFEGRPCDGYERSERIGSESVNGRATEKWRCTGEIRPAPGKSAVDSTSWFDPVLGFPVRETTDSGEVFEIRDIIVARQDASLFTIPRGFQKLDMDAMMQQMMKQQGQ